VGITGIPIGANPQITGRSTLSPQQLSPVKPLLDALGIQTRNVTRIVKQTGIPPQLHEQLLSLQKAKFTADRKKTLKPFNLGDISLAIAIQNDEEIKKVRQRIRKGLLEIQASMISKEDLDKMLSLLGINTDSTSLILMDNDGGTLLIQEGLELQSNK